VSSFWVACHRSRNQFGGSSRSGRSGTDDRQAALDRQVKKLQDDLEASTRHVADLQKELISIQAQLKALQDGARAAVPVKEEPNPAREEPGGIGGGSPPAPAKEEPYQDQRIFREGRPLDLKSLEAPDRPFSAARTSRGTCSLATTSS